MIYYPENHIKKIIKKIKQPETNLLKNWEVKFYDKADKKYITVVGDVYNDIKHRFEDGACIETSRIVKIDFANGIVETLNSVYHLDEGETK